VPIALAILLAARRLIPHDAAPERRQGGYDLAGAVSITASMLLLVAHRRRGADRRLGLGADARLVRRGSSALLSAFFAIERRSPHPLIRLGILRAAALAPRERDRDGGVRRLRRLPVHRHALPAVAQRLVGARDGARIPARRPARRRRRANASAPSCSASAPAV